MFSEFEYIICQIDTIVTSFYKIVGRNQSIYLPLLLDTDPRRLFSRDRIVLRDFSDGESDRIRLALG